VDAREYGLPTTSFTRWRVTEVRSDPLPVRGIGRAKWHLELMRCRAGNGADFVVEACDAKGNIALSTLLADGSHETGYGEYRAVS
ncbi:MAG TPA: damage-inducible protein, partial [Asticcacaulis sp.]|nr:damage-inducible protein [Asticcacaulis sp.]